MGYRKSPLLAATVSLIALTALGGCTQTASLFGPSPGALHAESSNPEYHAAMQKADDARTRGDLTAAIQSYSRAAQFEPHLVQPLAELGDVFWQMKNPADSVRALEKARAIEPGNEAVLRNLGRAYVALNEPKKAQESYLAALAIDPTNIRTLNGLGIAYDLDGDHETAQSHYKSGLLIKPTDADLQNNLAYSYISAKKYGEAVKILEPLVDHAGATARHRQNLALAYGLMGREDDASRVARADLSPAEIERNLKVYRQLRNEPKHGHAIASIGTPTYTPAPQEPVPDMAPAPAAVTAEVVPPPEPEIIGVPDGAVLVKPPAPEPKPEPEPKPAPAANSEPLNITAPPATAVVAEPMVPVTAPAVPAVARPQPTDLVAAPPPPPPASLQPAPPLPAPATQSALGSGKIYLGKFSSEAAARESWIRVWTANSTSLSSLVASIEPGDGQFALYAVGSSNAEQASQICLKLRQNGVSCGVSK